MKLIIMVNLVILAMVTSCNLQQNMYNVWDYIWGLRNIQQRDSEQNESGQGWKKARRNLTKKLSLPFHFLILFGSLIFSGFFPWSIFLTEMHWTHILRRSCRPIIDGASSPPPFPCRILIKIHIILIWNSWFRFQIVEKYYRQFIHLKMYQYRKENKWFHLPLFLRHNRLNLP